jgi:hypothetical protein
LAGVVFHFSSLQPKKTQNIPHPFSGFVFVEGGTVSVESARPSQVAAKETLDNKT